MGENDDRLELLKHRYRNREILLDKGILAAILALLVVIANARLESYKSSLQNDLESYKVSLQSQLDDIRASREKQRVLAEREVTAHENIWKGLADLRRFLAPHFGKPLDDATETELTKNIFNFTQVVEGEALYLEDSLRNSLKSFMEEALPEFVVSWQSAPELSNEIWERLSAKIEAIGEATRSAIYAKRGKLNDDKPEASAGHS